MNSESRPTSIELAHTAAAQLPPSPLPPPAIHDTCLLDEGHDQDDISTAPININAPQHHRHENALCFIAIRRGTGNLGSNCIFDNWADPKIDLQETGSEYSIFDNISDAVKYAFQIDLQRIDSRTLDNGTEDDINDSILAENLMEQILPSSTLLRIPQVHEDFISLAHDAAAAMNRDDDVQLQHADIDLPQHLPLEQHHHDEVQNQIIHENIERITHQELEHIEANSKANPLLEIVATTRNHFQSLPTELSDGRQGQKRKHRSMRKTSSSKRSIEWNQRYNLLITYMNQHNFTNASNIPSKLPPDFSPLNAWINTQKNEYRKLQNTGDSKLTAAQVQKLNDVGIKFTKKRNYVTWEKRIEELQTFKEINGHARVPVSHPTLGSWISDQRKEYKRYINNDPKSKFTQDKLQSLIDLGFVFEAAKKSQQYDSRSSSKSWEERFEELKEYKSLFGHTIVPQHYPNLGWWVNTQRKEHKKLKSGQKTSLTIERCLMLTETGFCFDASSKRGSTNYDYDVPPAR
eukprot:scaffold107_cov269-Chaetoceros_neogracile.AAC.35